MNLLPKLQVVQKLTENNKKFYISKIFDLKIYLSISFKKERNNETFPVVLIHFFPAISSFGIKY